jgi:glycosyl transferase, family 25
LNFTELNKLVINLPDRKDRLESFKKELVYLPCSNLQVIPGVVHQNPMIGIAQAHINAILIAKQNGWEQVLIMEDDVCFKGKEKTYDYVINCLENIPENWDILLGGIYFCKKLEKENEYWSKVGEFCALHFYIVNSKAYDKILEYNFKQHIDRWMNQKDGLNCYVANKFFATQRNGFSDNTKLKTDYDILLKKFKLL